MSDGTDKTLPDSDLETVRTCQDCGAVMPASHTGSICPKCVLGLAAEPPAAQLGEAEGDVIGPYTLRQKIGEGGFGVVWMAEQTQPMQRMVALKVVKAGMDTKQVLARFEAEQQALALLDHPNIAKVLDAGATETGRPYFVMELVKGIPITQFCQEQKLATKARLDLFRDVCSAINHAHQKGIIHRDLKPSNVMVTLHGDAPVAKVIDFGIAKATQQKLTDKTLFTRFEQFLGTPVYMSPEQAALSGLDIDTRSDIYSLGVLLYELLAGKPPFDPKTLLSKGYEEMRRIIREDEPPKPSTKLTETQSSAGNQSINVSPSALKGELDWIIMKAIDKDRGRRYETANAFAADIGRFLESEPVLAAAPSAAYKFRKFARRNKAVLGVAAAMIALLLGGIVATSWQAVRATAERDRAEEAREEAEGISAFLTGMFESARPGEEKGGRDVKVADVLDDAVKKLETELLDQPALRAKLQGAIGETYEALGLSREAIPLHEQALEFHRKHSGLEHPKTLHEMGALASSYHDAGRWEEALKMLEELWERRGMITDLEHQDTLDTVIHLAMNYDSAGRGKEAVKMREELYERRRKVSGPEHPETLGAMNQLALSYHGAGRWEEALNMREEVLKLSLKVLGTEHPETLTAKHNLATSYRDTGREEEAIKTLEEVLKLSLKVSGPEHPDTVSLMHNLALFYHDAGRGGDAIKTQEEVLKLRLRVSGPEHPATLTATNNLAIAYHNSGRREEALEMREEVLKLRLKVNGSEHPNTLKAMGNLAESYHNAGRREEALKLREKVWQLSPEVIGPEHPDTLAAMHLLASYYHDAGRKEEALKMREEVLKLRLKVNGSEHPDTLGAMGNLASSYHDAGRRKEALKVREKLLKLSLEENGSEHLTTLAAMGHLASSYYDAGRREEALQKREEVMELTLKISGPEHPNTLTTMSELAQSYHNAGRREEALKLREKVWQLSPEAIGPEHPDTLKAMNDLALSYHAAGRIEEALKVQEEVRELTVKVIGPEHPNTLRAMNNLANSYHAAGRKEEALKTLEAVLKLSLKVNGSEHPDTLLVVKSLDASYDACENPEQRIDGYKSLVKLFPEKDEVHSKLGKHLYEAKRYDQAIGPLRAALAQNPLAEDSQHTRVRLVRALQALKRNSEANQVIAELASSPGALDESSPKVAATLIPPGAEWRWLHPTDGTDPETNVPQFHASFFKADFDDSSWNSGRDGEGTTGGFGYGEAWFTGLDIEKPKKGNRHSAYFRCRFTTTGAHSHLELRCQRDDGLIVYLDGKEFGRDNMPKEPAAYQLHALESVYSEEQQIYRIPLSGGIDAGDHVLAISLHNQSDTSSDLRIGDISLVAVEKRRERLWRQAAAAFDADELREAGKQAVIDRRFADALLQFERLVKMEPFSNGGDLLGLGTLCVFLGNEERFTSLLETLFQRSDLESLGGHSITLISILPHDNNPTLPVDDWRRESLRLATLRTDRVDSATYPWWRALQRGKIEYRSGNWEVASEWLAKAPKIRPNYRNKGFLGQIHGFLAMARFRAGQNEEAKAELTLGLKHFQGKPSYRDLWYDEMLAYLALQEAWNLIEGAEAKNETLELWKEMRRTAMNHE